MKIVVPTEEKIGLNDKVADHFGRSQFYTFLNEKGEVEKIIKNTSEHMGGQNFPPELMKKHGVDILLCKDIGPRALNLCWKLGIEIYCSEALRVVDIFGMWKDGKLKKASLKNACKEHKL